MMKIKSARERRKEDMYIAVVASIDFCEHPAELLLAKFSEAYALT